MIAATKECGLDCIEQGPRFIDPLINEKYMDVVKKYRENGLTISGYGVLKFNTDAELSRKWFEFALMPFSAHLLNFQRGFADDY